MKGYAIALSVVILAVTLATAGKSAVAHRASGARWVDSIGASGGVVWAVDRHHFVWLTTDSGRTWRVSLRSGSWPKRVRGERFVVQSPREMADLEQVQFVDKRHGWVSAELDGDPFTPPVDTRPWAIERTVDGGRTWRISWLPGCGCGNGFLSFYDARHGYVVAADRLGRGKPRLFRTADGGESWTLVGHAPEFGPITFLDRRDGILGTYPGATRGPLGGRVRRIPAVLYRTTDGGKTWSKYRVPPPSSFYLPLPVRTFGRSAVVASGLYGHRPKIYTSIDAGATWNVVAPTLPAKAPVSDFSVGSRKMWAFATPRKLYITRDGGTSWGWIVPRGLPEPDAIYQPLLFSSPRAGWAVLGLANFKELYRTTDGGRDWAPVMLRRSRATGS